MLRNCSFVSFLDNGNNKTSKSSDQANGCFRSLSSTSSNDSHHLGYPDASEEHEISSEDGDRSDDDDEGSDVDIIGDTKMYLVS